MAAPKQTRLTLKVREQAHECPAWSLAWLPDQNHDILFTGGADGVIKKWNISAVNKKYASLFDDDGDNEMNMNGDKKEEEDVFELTNTARKSIGISPITDIKCVPVPGSDDTYLLSTVSVDSFVRVYAINLNDNKLYPINKNLNNQHDDNENDDENSSGINEYKQYDMNARHRVYLCDQNGKKSHPQYLEQYGGCWSSDINSDCSVIATGDQFGQIYLWNLIDENDEKKVPTVLQALVPQVKLHWNKNNKNKLNKSLKSSANNNGVIDKELKPKTLRGAHAMVRGVTFNRRLNPNWLAVSCQEAQRIEVFDIEKCVSIFNRKLTYKEIRDCVWYHGGAESYLSVACDDNFVHVYDISQNKKNSKKALMASLASHKSCVTSVDFGRKQYVVSGSMDNTMKLWNLSAINDKLIETHNDHNDQVWKVRFNQNNDKLATIGDDGYLCLYTIKY